MFGDMVDGLANRRDPRARGATATIWRSGAREVPVDPPGRASRRAAHGAAWRRSRAPTL